MPKAGTATPRGSPPPAAAPDRIQPSEIVAALAPYGEEGITLPDLLTKFRTRIDKPGSSTKNEWIQMVKSHAVYGPDRRLRPKTGNKAAQA